MTEYSYDEQKEIGARIRAKIEQLGMTRLDVAQQSKMTPKTLRNIINGHAFPKSQEVIRLSHTLQSSPNYILTGSDVFEPEQFDDELDKLQSQIASMMKIAALVSKLDKADSDSIERIVRVMLASKLNVNELKAAEEEAENLFNMFSDTMFKDVIKVQQDIIEKREAR